MAAWGLLGVLAGIAFYKPELVGYFDDKKEIVRKQARTGLSVMAVPVACMVVSEIVGYIVYIFTAKPGETFFGWRLYAFGLAGIIMAVLLMRSCIPCNFITVTIFTFYKCVCYIRWNYEYCSHDDEQHIYGFRQCKYIMGGTETSVHNRSTL